MKAGRRDEAVALWAEAEAMYTQVGVDAGVAESRRELARLRGGEQERG